VSNNNAFLKSRHEIKAVVIPKDTKAAIEEDASEEDYESEDEKPEVSPEKDKGITIQEVANQIFD